MAKKQQYANDPMGSYEDSQIRKWQAIYLYQNYTAGEVSKITGYAVSTVRSYSNKYRDELADAIEFFEHIEEDLTKRRKSIVTDATVQYGETEITWLNGTQAKDIDGGEKAYLFRFYETSKNTPVFSKIGTTTKTCLARLKQEIRYYNSAKVGFDIERVEICEIWDCGEMPAESYESFMRALLIRQYPNTWKKNDRFFGVTIPTETFIELCQQYSQM